MSYESWIAVASRSFPRRWRAERGHELIDTVVDLAPEGRSRPSFAVVADIVAAGLHERRRTHPPLRQWLGYVGTRKLPRRWHPWMRDDLTGRWFWLRTALRTNGATLLIFAIVSAVAQVRPPFAVWYFVVILAVGAIATPRIRSRTWRQNGYNSDGTTWQPPSPNVVRYFPPAPSHPIVPSLRAIGPGLAFGSLGWLYGAAFPHESFTIFGLTFQHDPNSPTTRGTVAALAAAGLVLGLALGMALAVMFARHAVAARPQIGASAPRRQAAAHLVVFVVLTLAALVAATGAYPALATAVVGSVNLFAGSAATFVGFRHRASPVTWADVLNQGKPHEAQRVR
jgi:hypothetical protein